MSDSNSSLKTRLLVWFLGSDEIPQVTTAGGGTPVNSSDGRDNLLQFTSAGHVLGFNSDGVIVGSASHMLKTEFVNANVGLGLYLRAQTGRCGFGLTTCR